MWWLWLAIKRGSIVKKMWAIEWKENVDFQFCNTYNLFKTNNVIYY